MINRGTEEKSEIARFGLLDWKYYGKSLVFERLSQIGKYEVGVCRWEVPISHTPGECMVYLGVEGYIKHTSINDVEFWEVADESKLYRNVRHPLPKERFWHLQKYAISSERVPDVHSLEEALTLAREKAEILNGITVEQNKLIAEIVKEFKLRDKAILEMESSLSI